MKVYAVDWSNTEDNLAVFDGRVITHEMPVPHKDTIIAVENIPLKYARPYFDAGGKLFRCDTSQTTKQRKADGVEKSHENDARIIYDLYKKSPEKFRAWTFDPFYAELGDLYSAFKEVQHSRVVASNRIYANTNARIKDVLTSLETHEKQILKEMEGILKTMPIYSEFLANIKGIGPAVSAGLLAYVGDIARFPNYSHMQAYFGLSVVDGKAPRKQKGKTANWHQKGRSLLLGVVGDMFIKQRTPLYRDIYDSEKARQIPLCETLGHAHKRATRKAVKRFFRDFYKSYKKLGPGLKVFSPNVVVEEKPVVKRAKRKKLELVTA